MVSFPAQRMTRTIPLLLVLLALALPLSLLAGRVWLDPATTPNAVLILAELRLPRSVLAIVVGAGLGAAGAAMQGYLRNPLADPGLFGIAPGAALGAVCALWFGYAASEYLLPLFALLGAGGAMALLAEIAGRTSGIALFTLAGLMVASLAGALTALAISLAPNAFAMETIVMWLNGALTDRGWHEVALAAPLVLAGIALLRAAGPALDALTLGEAVARSLGVNQRRLLWLLVGGIGLTVGGDHRGCRHDRLRRADRPAPRPPAHRPPPLAVDRAELTGRRIAGAGCRLRRSRAAARHRTQARHRAQPARRAVLSVAAAQDAEGGAMTLRDARTCVLAPQGERGPV